jgi:hypothetical protein
MEREETEARLTLGSERLHLVRFGLRDESGG